ncbi:MAG: VOC family protein [Polyangiales bacterium]
MLELGQVILGVGDLEAATQRIRGLGLEVLDGGVHPGIGTANRIVPLGRQYLALLGIVDGELARRNAIGKALAAQLGGGDRLVGWSLRTDRLEDLAVELDVAVEPRRRLRPDGTELAWRAAGVAASIARPWLPFFEEWDDPWRWPGAQPARHACRANGIAWLELAPEDESDLARWVGDAAVPMRLVGGEPGLRRVALATPNGELVLER